MRRMVQRTLWIYLCLVSLVWASAVAMPEASKQQLVLVPYAFSAGGQALPAGHYQVTAIKDFPSQLQIKNVALGATASVEVITRLAAGSSSDRGIRLVFDRVAGQYFLSEVWVAGQDGFVLCCTPEEHTHEVIVSDE
jgi:hypothetical protein